MAEPIEVPFLVVGAGPVGLTAARLLANAGHRCLVVERRPGPQSRPAAHVVNARTLEIFRQAGMDLAAIEAIAEDPAEAGHVNFVTTLGGDLIGRLPFERQGDECRELTPTPLRNISQHRLEPILAAEAEELGEPVGAIVMVIRRTYRTADRPVETADIVIPTDRYELGYLIPVG